MLRRAQRKNTLSIASSASTVSTCGWICCIDWHSIRFELRDPVRTGDERIAGVRADVAGDTRFGRCRPQHVDAVQPERGDRPAGRRRDLDGGAAVGERDHGGDGARDPAPRTAAVAPVRIAQYGPEAPPEGAVAPRSAPSHSCARPVIMLMSEPTATQV